MTLSPPIVVGRRSGCYWFPTLMRLGDGGLMVSAYDDLDAYSGRPMGLYNWSEDGGLTWSDPLATRAPFSECAVLLRNADHLLLPYRMLPDDGGTMRGVAGLVRKGQREILSPAKEVRVSGLPRMPKPQGDESAGEIVTAGFSFNGQTVDLPGDDGGYLTTLYGRFEGDARFTILFAESRDGFAWSVRSVLTGEECSLPGGEGPCEAALARLDDGRLICVFRTDGNIVNVYDAASATSATPYGVIYSADEGRSWTKPVQMSRPIQYGTREPSLRLPGSVQPALVSLPDGTVVLSGGRPGLFLWLRPSGSENEWIEVDLLAHHNQHCEPGESIDSLINTSSYTEVVAISDPDGRTDRPTLLVVYDRIPLGWRPIPRGSSEQCCVWAVRVTLDSD